MFAHDGLKRAGEVLFSCFPLVIPVLFEALVAKQSIIILLASLIVAHKLHTLPVQQTRLYFELSGPVKIVLNYFFGFGLAAENGHLIVIIIVQIEAICRQGEIILLFAMDADTFLNIRMMIQPCCSVNLIQQQSLSAMSAQGFKNLLKISLFNDDSFQPLLKKNEEYRKVTQLAIDHLQAISKNFQCFEGSYSKIIIDYDHQIEANDVATPQYYHEYVQLYRNMHSQHKFFSEKLSNNFREFTGLCHNIFTNYSNSILNFQGLIRSYKSHEQILFELSKKYFRTHKTMLSNIESYKNSFTDVKLIYNMDEKTKRFNACEGTYKNLLEQLEIIQEKVRQINEEKTQISESYTEICNQFKMALKTIGNKLITIAKMFMYDYCLMEKTMITYLAEKKFTLEKIQLKTFFNYESKIRNEDYFNVEIDKLKCQILPPLIVYCKHIKEESYGSLNILISTYLKELQAKIATRMLLNKKILQVTTNFTKAYEKNYYASLKDIMGNYEKIKKKLGDIFGNRLVSFMKSNNSVFDISLGINQKLLKRTPPKLKAVQSAIVEQGKTLDIFVKQMRSNIDKFFKKKQVKKIFEGAGQSIQFTEEEPSNADLTGFKVQLTSFCEYLAHLIQGFVQKIRKNQEQIKFQYNAFVNDLSISTNQIYSLCCEYQQLYFGEADFVNNFKKYEADIDKTLENQSKFFQGIDFGILLKKQQTSAKIVFDSQINKVEQYKKIKKPMEIEIEQQNLKKMQKDKQAASSNKQKAPDNEGSVSKQNPSVTPQKVQKPESKDKADSDKYQEFLMSKISFLPDEKFYKSFSCGLSDKIILTGRLFITNKRLCFHSKFNPNNVFFGDTFMQIPKKDIRKIQKRYNAIVFDNSISITTIHGEVFLTSFFSRNQAFDLICSALDINSQEIMYEPEQIKDQPVVEQTGPLKQDDDFQEDQLQLRKQKIQKMLTDFPYKQLHQAEFSFKGLDALKFFKLFEQGVEFSYNRKTYKSWAAYFKDLLEHKDYEIGEWTPQISQYLNSGNIKCNMPECFTKKINCLVPISNSGVPFMPKHAKSEEIVSLYFYSKDKFVLQSTIQNSGVPYSDTFSLKLRKVFETSGEDKCKMTSYMYLNFVTSTIMKGVIESKSAEQTKSSFVRYEQEVNKYFKNLNKLKNKFVKNQSSADEGQTNIQNANNQQYEKEINQLRQSEQKTKTQLKECKAKFQKGKKILLGSIILNILLILILIS